MMASTTGASTLHTQQTFVMTTQYSRKLVIIPMQEMLQDVRSLNVQQLLAFGVFASYFLLIFWLFSRILTSVKLASFGHSRSSGNVVKIWLFRALTAASFAHTWFYMFKYMAWSFANYEATKSVSTSTGGPLRMANWLLNTSLFEEAWAAVCFGKMNWWWSEQLCLFTVGAWTVFLYVEGSRHNIKYVWAYMLLGQVVAISVASNLFYIAILSSKPTPRSEAGIAVPAKLWIPVILSLATIPISPFTNENTFLPNLLVMHVLIALPLFFVSPLKPTKSWLNLSTFYLFVFFVCIPIRSRTILTAAGSLPSTDESPYALFEAAWTVLYSHPAQSSIGWDVVWSTISFVTWIALTPAISNKLFTIPYLILATPFASVGLTAPYVLRPRLPDTEHALAKDE